MYKYTHYIAPALVATEECLLGILPMSTRYKVPDRWHLSAQVSRVWHSNRRKAGKKETISQHGKTL